MIPRFDSVIRSLEWKESLSDRYVSAAPRRPTPYELRQVEVLHGQGLPMASAIFRTDVLAFNISSIRRLSRRFSSMWANLVLLAFQQDRASVATQFKMCPEALQCAQNRDYV